MRTLKHTSRILLVACSVMSLAACSHFFAAHEKTDALSQLENLRGVKPSENGQGGLSGIREMALEETGLSLGARAGLAKRSKEINAELQENSKNLDHTFNFQLLVLDHNVLPPVLLEGHNTLNLDSPDAIRISDRDYQIEQQARFVTAPPHWRDYLYLDYHEPELPYRTMLPKNLKEREVWRIAVKKGWHQGIKQANQIFTENLARLTKDYRGMVLYRKLLAQHMVSPPYVAKTELGVTGDGNHMSVNDQVLRIAAMPSLNMRSQTWRPAVSVENPNLANPHAVFRGPIPGKETSSSTVAASSHHPIVIETFQP